MNSVRFAFALGVLSSTQAMAQAPRHYVNARFGFSVDVPAGFTANDPPANGDGLAFQSPSGAVVVTASAFINPVEPGTRAEAMIVSFHRISFNACHTHRPVYEDIHADWAVVSCPSPGGRTLYQRSAVRGRGADAVFTTVRITYPADQSERWDPVAVSVTRSMTPARGQ